jgi:hypothetical protein
MKPTLPDGSAKESWGPSPAGVAVVVVAWVEVVAGVEVDADVLVVVPLFPQPASASNAIAPTESSPSLERTEDFPFAAT